MKIGDTLYRFDINRRRYTKPANGRAWGDLIYAEHFEPLKIVGENKVSWLIEHRYKANKKDPRKNGFFTAEQMADDIWMKDHKHRIRDLLDHASADQLREIAKILGYSETTRGLQNAIPTANASPTNTATTIAATPSQNPSTARNADS